MLTRGNIYKKWIEQSVAGEGMEQAVENGCHLEVRAREVPDGNIELLVCVYDREGQCVAERVKQLPGAQWTVQNALKRGIDQAERIAGGESGRLPCADANKHDAE